MLSPLTGLIDAARPDSDAARRFASHVDGLLSDAPRFEAHAMQLRNTFTRWQADGPELEVLIEDSPALHEARPLAKDLSELGTTGLEALSYISRGVAAPPEWRDARLAAVEQAAKPKAALEFVVVQSLRQLIHAAAELPRLGQLTPAEWKAQVKTLAAPAPPAPRPGH
jgi:hexosaminidase